MRRLLALLVLLLPLAATRADGPAPAPGRAEHAVLVVLGGRVGPKEMLDKTVMPTLADVAAKGFAIDDLRSDATSPYQAAMRLLTGRSDGPDPASRPRPKAPTILERARRALSLPMEGVWFVSHAGGDELHLVPSDDPDHGPAAAPGIAYGDGAFAEPLRDLLDAWGHPLPTEEETWTILRGLRLENRRAVETWLPREVDAGTAEAERVERALLAELDRSTLLAKGPAPDDQRALRAATTLLRVHHPVLLVVRLGGGVEAEAGADRYLDVLRADDAALASLRAAVEADDALRGRTAFWIVAALGRAPAGGKGDAKGDAKAEARARETVALVGEGPGVRKGARVRGDKRLLDVAPTLARLLGFDMPAAEGTVLPGLLDDGPPRK